MRISIRSDLIEPDENLNVIVAELLYLAGDLEAKNPWAAKFLRCAAIFLEPQAMPDPEPNEQAPYDAMAGVDPPDAVRRSA